MEQKSLCPPYSPSAGASLQPHVEQAEMDLIFVQNLGMVPKRLVSASRPATPPAAQRKWLGSDFSHVIISQ